MSKVHEVNVADEELYLELWQYDSGQILKFVTTTIADGSQVLFANAVTRKAIRKEVSNNEVGIPNKFLRATGKLHITVETLSEEEETTLYEINGYIKRRQEGEPGAEPEDEPTFIQKILIKIREIEAALLGKQNKLIPGPNISIVDDVISATGGGDLSDYYTKTQVNDIELHNGRTLGVTIDSSTYVCTFTLKNSEGSTISTASIDLPLESVVVSGSYDSTNKKVILTLQNGQTVEFSVADLVSGLVSTNDLETALANYQVALTVTGHGTLNNGTLNIDASKTYFGTDSGNRINATGQYADIQEGDLYILTANSQSIVKVVATVVTPSIGTPYFTVKPIDNTIVDSYARPNSMPDYNYTKIDIGCIWIDTQHNRVSVLKSHSGSAPDIVFNWIDLPNASDLSSKQDTIDSTHKLSADNVDDTSATNKFVTASDITAWNGKQDEIDSSHKLSSDLVDDTNNTNLFVTSSEKSTWNDKADDTTISTDTTSTTVSLTLADNHEYRYTQDLSALTLTMPSGDFISSIVFASGSTPTSMTYDSSIKWSGDDVISNAFVPSASKTYNIVFWYDGININAVVRGVA